jgi:charged multivesicular body protein 4
MFGKLFGSTAPKQENKADPAAAQATINKMQEQIENIEMRIKKLDNDQQVYKKQALEKSKAGDKRAAVIALRKSKMFEKELAKLEGQQMMMEQ